MSAVLSPDVEEPRPVESKVEPEIDEELKASKSDELKSDLN